MSTGLSGTAQISGFFNPILEAALEVARENVIMPALVTQYSAVGWADRKLSIYPQITAQTVAETDDFANPTAFDKSSQATLTPIEIGAQVILTDRRIETDPDGARADAARELGLAISDKIESDLVGLFSSFSTGLGTAGSSFTLANVGAAIAQLRNAKATGPFYVVLHPFHWYDIWVEIGKPSTSVVADSVATGALKDYFVANLVSAQWYQHAGISVDSNDDAYSGVFNRDALALDTRRAPTLEPERDASKRAYEVNITAGYAKGVRRTAFGRKIIADATAP